jgi:uncharacterized protein YndB with AHSA1/START domain
MSDDAAINDRSIEIEVEVPGSAEEVWQAVATGPGVSSWYVPHRIEERVGGAADASFGPGPEMVASGRVAVWDPPRRLVITGETEGEGLSFEWQVEPQAAGTCRVRLVNSGFGDGPEWDVQYDAMARGWEIFLTNLRLHLEYFAPEPAAAMLPMAVWPVVEDTAWATLTGGLGLPGTADGGEHVAVSSTSGAPELSGVVVKAAPGWYALLIDQPASGTGFISTEGHGEASAVSIWLYLYGEEGRSAVARDDTRWRRWLEAAAPRPSSSASGPYPHGGDDNA